MRRSWAGKHHLHRADWQYRSERSEAWLTIKSVQKEKFPVSAAPGMPCFQRRADLNSRTSIERFVLVSADRPSAYGGVRSDKRVSQLDKLAEFAWPSGTVAAALAP